MSTALSYTTTQSKAYLLSARHICYAPDIACHQVCEVRTHFPSFISQVSTVLANAASGGDACLRRLAVPALVRYLHVTPGQRWADGARAACRRLQQKTAVALTRLCADRRTACHLVTSGGTARLELLCRQPELRGRDDGVLVACLVCEGARYRVLASPERLKLAVLRTQSINTRSASNLWFYSTVQQG